jgi:hypothetical protein
MTEEQKKQMVLFEDIPVRREWDADNEKWLFSIVDIIAVLTEQETQRGATFYWAKLKERLLDEGAGQLLTNCQQLKMIATDGKLRLTDVADLEQIFRLIQSIPSKKVEPLKMMRTRHTRV